MTCLVTKDPVEIADNTVCVKSNGFIFFPFKDNFRWLIKNARDFESTAIYFDYISSRDDFKEDPPMVELISVIEKYKIKNFILEHYFEFGDIPADHFFMKVAEGYIVHDSLVFDEDDEVSEQNYLRMHQHKKNFGLEDYWFSQADLF